MPNYIRIPYFSSVMAPLAHIYYIYQSQTGEVVQTLQSPYEENPHLLLALFIPISECDRARKTESRQEWHPKRESVSTTNAILNSHKLLV